MILVDSEEDALLVRAALSEYATALFNKAAMSRLPETAEGFKRRADQAECLCDTVTVRGVAG